MSDGKLVSIDEGSPEGDGSNAKAPATAENPTWRAGHDIAGKAASEMVMRGSADAAGYAALIRRHPERRQKLIAFLHQRFGNAFVAAVLDALHRTPRAAPVPDGAQGAADQQGMADSATDGARPARPEDGSKADRGAAKRADANGPEPSGRRDEGRAGGQPNNASTTWPTESVKEGPKQRPAPTEAALQSRIGFPERVDVGDLVVGVGGYHTAVDVPISSHDNDEIEIGATVIGAPDVHIVSQQPLFLKAGSTGALRLDVNPRSARSGSIDGHLNLVATWRRPDDVGQPDRLRASIPIKGTVRDDVSDRIPTQGDKSDPVAAKQPQQRERAPVVEQGADEVMSRSGMPTQLPAGSRTVTPDEHRSSVINAIQGSFGSFFATITKGKSEAETAAGGEVPHDGDLGPLLSLLGTVAGFAVVGAASTFGYLAVQKAAEFSGFFKKKTAEKFVENVIKEGIKHVVGMATKSKPKSMAGLKSGFFSALTSELTEREGEFMTDWVGYEDQLRSLEPEDLEQVLMQVKAVMSNLKDVLGRMTQTFLVSWSNFLAQAKHGGAMAGWDHAERHGSMGAMQLQDAADRPGHRDTDPTRANVAPDKMRESMDRTGQWAWTQTESGMLEVFVNVDGELRSKGPKMRLADISGEAKEKLAEIPRVGDAHLNKVVRIMDGANVVASLLITADGYIRNSSGAAGPEFDSRAIAEKVQNLPMSELER